MIVRDIQQHTWGSCSPTKMRILNLFIKTGVMRTFLSKDARWFFTLFILIVAAPNAKLWHRTKQVWRVPMADSSGYLPSFAPCVQALLYIVLASESWPVWSSSLQLVVCIWPFSHLSIKERVASVLWGLTVQKRWTNAKIKRWTNANKGWTNGCHLDDTTRKLFAHISTP
jgi:hypothetical protein